MISSDQKTELKTFLCTYNGRINRAKYWLGVVGTSVIYVIFSIIIGVLSGIIGSSAVYFVLLAPVGLAMLYVSIMLGIKRFHDLDKPGWFLLIGLIPFVGGLALLIWLGFIEGTNGPNQYGEDVRSTKVLGIA